MEHNLELGDRLEVNIGGKGCVSDLQEISPRGNPVISAPMYRITRVPISEGEMLRVSYYRGGGVYSFMARVAGRFKDGGVDLVELEVKSAISKYQRREFVRLDTAAPLDARLIALPENILERSAQELLQALCDTRFLGRPRPPVENETIYRCQTINVSGGGACFASQENMKRGSLLECTFHLDEAGDVTADGQIVRTDRVLSPRSEWWVSIQFVNIDESIRRRFIKYIVDRQANV